NLTWEGKAGEDALKGVFVSDGKTLATKSERAGEQDSKSRAASNKLSEYLTGWLARGGLFMTLVYAVSPDEPRDPGQFKLSGFKTAGKDKVRGREANVIEYQAARGNDKATCKLWLDVQSGLPLKRVFEFGKFPIIETYSQWELDPTLPKTAFTLPK